MAADLFYFLSSLPTLRWGEKPPCSYEDFQKKVATELGEKFSALLEGLPLAPEDDDVTTSQVAQAWHDREAFHRNIIAQKREAKLHKEPSPRHATTHLSPSDQKQVEDIMDKPSPVEREEELDKLRWRFLDELAATHNFDAGSLEIYALRLRLLAKVASRSMEPGRKAFFQLVDNTIEQARQNRQGGESAN